MIDERLDRSKIVLTTHDQADRDDVAFWMSRTPDERIEGIEYLRRWLYGDIAIDAGFQRVLELVELQRD
jgi:hypothetical protein